MEALRVCTERAAKSEIREVALEGVSIEARQHSAACASGNLGGIAAAGG